MISSTWVRQRANLVYFGWWIVAAGVGVQVLMHGLLMQAFGAYVVVMQAEFGWSRTAFSAAFSLQQAEGGLLGPLQGWLLDRFGPRPVMIAGILFLGGGFIAFSQINALWTFYATFMVMAIGVSLAGFKTLGMTVVNWFSRRRATAMGIVYSGLGIGGALVPAVAWSLSTYGWRQTAFVSGVLILIFGLPFSMLFRHTPEQHGLHPDGDSPEEVARNTRNATVSATESDFTIREAVRTSAFWLVSAGHGLGVLIVGAVMVHAVSHMNDGLGYSLTLAASMITLMTTMSIVGNLAGGYLGDRISKTKLAAICMIGSGIAIVLLAWATSLAMVIAFAVIQGLAHGTRGVLMMPIRADFFGRRSFGQIMGWSSLIVMFGMMGGPIVAGVMVDTIGNYQLAFTILGILVALGSLTFVFARKPVHPEDRPGSPAPA